MKIAAVAALSLVLASGLGAAGLPDPAPFDAVLAARARNGGFDYKGMTGQDAKRLAAYRANLGDAKPSGMTPDEKKAFYINAYNAIAIQTLLENPGKKITDVGGAFNGAKRRVGGRMLTLDDIENRLRETGDARIHFAIVCASRSCPQLLARAYRPEGLTEALDRQARAFVGDPAKNVVDRGAGRLALSKIFFWNRKEFERDGGGSLVRFVARYVSDPSAAAWVTGFSREPEFLEYDWRPNQP
ncbi:MAG: DUF547 domain-containing protein [Thermoanaerobaculia bacterium]